MSVSASRNIVGSLTLGVAVPATTLALAVANGVLTRMQATQMSSKLPIRGHSEEEKGRSAGAAESPL